MNSVLLHSWQTNRALMALLYEGGSASGALTAHNGLPAQRGGQFDYPLGRLLARPPSREYNHSSTNIQTTMVASSCKIRSSMWPRNLVPVLDHPGVLNCVVGYWLKIQVHGRQWGWNKRRGLEKLAIVKRKRTLQRLLQDCRCMHRHCVGWEKRVNSSSVVESIPINQSQLDLSSYFIIHSHISAIPSFSARKREI